MLKSQKLLHNSEKRSTFASDLENKAILLLLLTY